MPGQNFSNKKINGKRIFTDKKSSKLVRENNSLGQAQNRENNFAPRQMLEIRTNRKGIMQDNLAKIHKQNRNYKKEIMIVADNTTYPQQILDRKMKLQNIVQNNPATVAQQNMDYKYDRGIVAPYTPYFLRMPEWGMNLQNIVQNNPVMFATQNMEYKYDKERGRYYATNPLRTSGWRGNLQNNPVMLAQQNMEHKYGEGMGARYTTAPEQVLETKIKQQGIMRNNLAIIHEKNWDNKYYKDIVQHYTSYLVNGKGIEQLCLEIRTAIETVELNEKVLYLFKKSAESNNSRIDMLLRDLTTRKLFDNQDKAFMPRGFGVISAISTKNISHFYTLFRKATAEAKWFMLQYASNKQICKAIKKALSLLLSKKVAIEKIDSPVALYEAEKGVETSYYAYKLLRSEQFYRNFKGSFQQKWDEEQETLLSEKEVLDEQIMCFFRGRNTNKLENALTENKELEETLKDWIQRKSPEKLYHLYQKRMCTGRPILYRYATLEQKLYLFGNGCEIYDSTDTMVAKIQSMSPIEIFLLLEKWEWPFLRSKMMRLFTEQQKEGLLKEKQRLYKALSTMTEVKMDAMRKLIMPENFIESQQVLDAHNQSVDEMNKMIEEMVNIKNCSDTGISARQVLLQRLSPLQYAKISAGTGKLQLLIRTTLSEKQFYQVCEGMSEEEKWSFLDYATKEQLCYYIQKMNQSEKKELEKKKLFEAIAEKLILAIWKVPLERERQDILRKNFEHYFGKDKNFGQAFLFEFWESLIESNEYQGLSDLHREVLSKAFRQFIATDPSDQLGKRERGDVSFIMGKEPELESSFLYKGIAKK